MVKKAEKVRKRNPLLPVFGAIVAVGLGAIAYVVSSQFVIKIPQVRNTIAGNEPLATWAFTFIIWLVFLGLAYFVVAVGAGKDPDTKQPPLPPRQKDLPPEQRRQKRR